jgi:hypothetical protein
VKFAQRLKYRELLAASTSKITEIAVFILQQSGPGAIPMQLGDRRPDVSPNSIGRLTGEVRDGLNGLLDGNGWGVVARPPVIRRVVNGDHRPRAVWNLPWSTVISAAVLCNLFLLCAQDLLIEEGEALARCALTDCKCMFVKDDPRQRFCTPAHTAVDRMRRYRTKTRVSLETVPESKPRKSRPQRLAGSAKDRARAI